MHAPAHRPLVLAALVSITAIDAAALLAFLLHQGFDVAAGPAWGLAAVATLGLLPPITWLARGFLASLDRTESVTFAGDNIP